jgi:hypothetical protein
MSYSNEVSPVGWYVGTYQLRFVELASKTNQEPDRRFSVWDNTVLVKASNLVEAYRKITKIGRGATKPYKGGPDAVAVRWLFEGIIELVPVYEEIEDGAEIMWANRVKSLKSVRNRCISMAELKHNFRAQQTAQKATGPKRPAF